MLSQYFLAISLLIIRDFYDFSPYTFSIYIYFSIYTIPKS